MQFTLYTPDRQLIDDTEVTAVYASAQGTGHFGILPGHQPMIAALGVDVLRFEKAGRQVPVAVLGGLLETDGEHVTVLAQSAELGDDIDHARAEQARERAEARLREKAGNVDGARAERALSRAMARLKASGSRIVAGR